MGKAQQTNDAALRKKIDAAITDIEREGGKATSEAIQQAVRGSYRDLLPAIRAVKAERAERALAREQVPDVPDAVMLAFGDVWEAAWRAADESGAAARKGFAAEIDERDAAIADLEALAADLEQERDAAVTANAKLEAEGVQLRVELARVRSALEGAEIRLAERAQVLEALLARPGHTPDISVAADAEEMRPNAGDRGDASDASVLPQLPFGAGPGPKAKAADGARSQA